MSRWLCAALAAGLVACGGSSDEAPARQALSGTSARQGASGPNRPPQIDYIALSVEQPRVGTEIEARFDAADPDRDALDFHIAWLRNGRVEQEGPSRTWTPSVLEKGDRIELRVVASDGRLESAPATASARVGNTAPVIAEVQLAPAAELKRGEPVIATPIASDEDGDEVEFRYAWFVNDKEVRGADEARFTSSEAKRGDRVRVRVTASDGEDDSAAIDSADLTLVNSPPRFAKFEGFQPAGGMFRHQFKASDPDGDGGLRFVLAEGPRGMEVDPVLGIATWSPGADASGVIPVQVEVRDAYGASSALRFEISIGGGEAASPAAQAGNE
jgi:hypothetical protein